MKKTDSKDKNYQKAKQTWQALVKADSQLYVQNRVTRCLPKHKKQFHLKLLAQLQAARMSALSAFSVASDKLTTEQTSALRAEVYV